jgi:F0F1-type ATP synthase membrane subunit b/b'
VSVQEGELMVTLVENIVSLENEADSIVDSARKEAQELEKSAMADAETYRRKLSVDTDEKISLFRKEMEEKHKASVVEAEAELVRALGAVDQIAEDVLRKQIDRIVNKFSEI